MPALTSLRFFAAFYVVLFHAYPYVPPDLPGAPPGLPVRAWHLFCSHGFSAVGFFFALSGFILAYNYPPSRLLSRRAFYRARFARIYPVYMLGLLLAMPFLAVHTLRDRSWGSAAVECTLAFTLLQAWVPAYWHAVNVPGWSLSVEAFFYAVYPLLLAPLTRAASSKPRALALLVALYALALLAPALGTWVFQVGASHRDVSAPANLLRYAPPFALPEFAFGVVLGHMRQQGFDSPRLTALLFGPALLVLVLVLASDAGPYMLLHNGLLLPALAIVILRCARGDDLPALLRHPWMQLLGEASYSLYVLHLLVWSYVKIVIERSGLDPGAAWVFPVYAAIALAASLVSYTSLEVPARVLLTRTFNPRRG